MTDDETIMAKRKKIPPTYRRLDVILGQPNRLIGLDYAFTFPIAKRKEDEFGNDRRWPALLSYHLCRYTKRKKTENFTNEPDLSSLEG